MPPDDPDTTSRKSGTAVSCKSSASFSSAKSGKPAEKPAAKPASSQAQPKRQGVVRPEWRPCNPSEARADITEREHGYVGMYSPYNRAHMLMMQDQRASNAACLAGEFVPCAYQQAKDIVKINYYLNSPDAETIEAERRYIREKSKRNMLDYLRRQQTNLSLMREGKRQNA